jgi:hypothetical protein
MNLVSEHVRGRPAMRGALTVLPLRDRIDRSRPE